MEDNRLSVAENRAWRGFVVASQVLTSQIERDLLASAKISLADFTVLQNLSEVDGHRLRATELADRMSWSRSRLSHQVARMESRGLVERDSCGDDARGSYVVLIKAGASLLGDAIPHYNNSIRTHLMELLNESQVSELGDISTAVLDHFYAEGAMSEECTSSAITNPEGAAETV